MREGHVGRALDKKKNMVSVTQLLVFRAWKDVRVRRTRRAVHHGRIATQWRRQRVTSRLFTAWASFTAWRKGARASHGEVERLRDELAKLRAEADALAQANLGRDGGGEEEEEEDDGGVGGGGGRRGTAGTRSEGKGAERRRSGENEGQPPSFVMVKIDIINNPTIQMLLSGEVVGHRDDIHHGGGGGGWDGSGGGQREGALQAAGRSRHMQAVMRSLIADLMEYIERMMGKYAAETPPPVEGVEEHLAGLQRTLRQVLLGEEGGGGRGGGKNNVQSSGQYCGAADVATQTDVSGDTRTHNDDGSISYGDGGRNKKSGAKSGNGGTRLALPEPNKRRAQKGGPLKVGRRKSKSGGGGGGWAINQLTGWIGGM